MLIGYNTNGFAHHGLRSAFEILHAIGYRAAAVTIERSIMPVPDPRGVREAVAHIRSANDGLDLALTIETGARFVLDPTRKHRPTLVDEDASGRAVRREFIRACMEVAAGVGATCVSLWSGAAPQPASEDLLHDRLVSELRLLIAEAARLSVRLAFEPEPGMFIDTMDRFERLHRDIGDEHFGLTLDVGHVHCLADGDIAEHILRWREEVWNIHIEDMRVGVHEHLPFGEGDMAFPPIVAALKAIDYPGPLHVELSRHSHDAVETARRSYAFLSACF